MMRRTWQIGDVCRTLGLTARAVRHYEAAGLVAPERRGAARIFMARDYRRLSVIARGRAAGLGLADIREVLEAFDPADGGRQQLQTAIDKLCARAVALDGERARVAELISGLRAQMADAEGALAPRPKWRVAS